MRWDQDRKSKATMPAWVHVHSLLTPQAPSQLQFCYDYFGSQIVLSLMSATL